MGAPFLSSAMSLLSRANSWALNQTFVGRLLGPVGSVGSPGYSFSSDTNTGMFRAAADTIALVTNGANRLQADSAGAIQTGATAAAAGYTSAGDITLPSARNIRAKNTCKSWVNFNGTGTPAIRDSFNVSSITDMGVGIYRVNFTNAMTDANYCAIACVNADTAGSYNNAQVSATTTGYVEVKSSPDQSSSWGDSSIVCVGVWGA